MAKTRTNLTKFERTTLNKFNSAMKQVEELTVAIKEKDEAHMRLMSKLLEANRENQKLARRADGLFKTAQRINQLMLKEIDMQNATDDITFFEKGQQPNMNRTQNGEVFGRNESNTAKQTAN